MGLISRIFGKKDEALIGTDGKFSCKKCGARILPQTAKITIGLCAPCYGNSNQNKNQHRIALTKNSIRSQCEIEFVESVLNGDNEKVKKFIKEGMSPNIVDKDGTPVLLLASEIGKLVILKTLLNAGANINKTNNSGATALMAAILNEQNEVAKYLIENNTDLDILAQGESAFSIAEQTVNFEIMLLIMSRKINLDKLLPKMDRLVEIGKDQDTVGPGYEFQESKEAETKEIGNILNDLGGFNLMLLGHAKVKVELGNIAARRLERVWGGIGDWLS